MARIRPSIYRTRPTPAPAVSEPTTPPLGDPQPAPPSNPLVPNLALPSWRTLTRWLLVVLALYGVGWLLWQAAPALTPFIIGLVLAFLLTPLVNRLNRRMPRWLAILTVYVAGIVLIAVGIAYVVPPVIGQIEQLITSLPSIPELQAMGGDLITRYQQIVPAAIRTQLDPAITSTIQGLEGNIATYVQGIGTFLLTQVVTIFNTITFLIGFLIIPIWLFYVLNDQQEGAQFIDRMLHPRLRPDFWNVWGMVNKIFSDYVRGQLLLCATIGVAVGIGLLILQLIGFQVQYILLLAIIAGITEFIPVLGPILGAIPAILLSLFISPQTALAVLAVYVIVQQLENNILVPRIVGESVGVHPAILTVVLIAMGQVFGLLGVVLSAPLCAIARDLFIYIYARLGGASAQAAIERVRTRTKVENPAPRTIAGQAKSA